MPDIIADIYIWNKIERILFTPENKKNDLLRWFNQYHKFVWKFWELDKEIPTGTRNKYCINFRGKIEISYTVPFALPKFSIDFKQDKIEQSFHYDEQFISKLDILNIYSSGIDKSKLKELKKIKPTHDDIKRILMSMIAHPALHHHFESISHFIRINFNTKNLFLFLYQFAFQLADYDTDFKHSELKQEELNKLIVLVKNNIEDETRIPSGELFKVIKV